MNSFNMSAKGCITTGILFCGFLAFIIGVPSYEMIYLNPGSSSTTNVQPSYSYMGACEDSTQYNAHCASLTSDFWHCMNGDKNILTYNYNILFWGFDLSSSQESSSNKLDETLCARIMTCEAFGLMAIILSFLSVTGALFYKNASRGNYNFCTIYGGVAGITASFFGSIALAIFFSSKPEYFNNWNGVVHAHDSDISGFLSDGTFKLGYSTGLQIAGIIASFIGGCCAFAVDFGNGTKADSQGLPMVEREKFVGTDMRGSMTATTQNIGNDSGSASARGSGNGVDQKTIEIGNVNANAPVVFH